MQKTNTGTIFTSMALILAVSTAVSASVLGDLKTGSAGTMRISLSSIIFLPDPGANPAGPPWNGEVSNGTSLTFAGCGGPLGAAGCLDAAPFAPAEAVEFASNDPITQTGGITPNNPFISFAGNGITHATIMYTAASVGPGSANINCAVLALGDSCSPISGSPLLMTSTATGTTITISAAGTVTDGAGTTNWQGEFTLPFAGITPEELQLFFCPSGTCTAADVAAGTAKNSSFSGDFLATAAGLGGGSSPEPGTIWTMLGAAAIAAAGLRKRKMR